MTSPLLRALDQRVVVLDGAMGSTLQSLPLSIDQDYLGHENCVDLLVRSRPELVQEIHESFLKVGSDAVETDTFGANPLVLSEFDPELASWTHGLNKEAAEVARAACDAHATPDQPRFVFGSMGPGTKLITLGQVDWDTMLDSYATQAAGLIEGGVDALLIETCQDLLQVKCATNGCLKAIEKAGRDTTEVPIFVNVTIETTGTMLLGTEISAAIAALSRYPIASLGLNCATGPIEMSSHLEAIAKHWPHRIACVPNAGLPVLVEGQSHFPLTPEPMAESIGRFIEKFGIDLVGGCCGTSPDHLKAIASRVRGLRRSDRSHSGWTPGCTSLYSAVPYRQESSFFIVGERMNASGSRAFKRLLESENWDEIISLARGQIREGANCLDINVDYVGRDNASDMAEVVSRVVRQVDAPLMLDSTQISTIEAGLRHAPGKCIINSANFEDGESKFDQMCMLAKAFGTGLVIGTIDEDPEAAMARTAERKHAIARRAIERATTVGGLAIEDIFIDPLVLPVSTGMDADRRSALELIEGTRKISESFPDVQITCGLSNCSFGLKPAARQVLNSVLMHELIEVGMSSAIVHASKIIPLNRIDQSRTDAAMHLIYDRRAESIGGTGLPEGISDESFDPLQSLINLFVDDEEAIAAVDVESRTLEEWLQSHIVDGDKQGLEDRLDEAMKTYPPLEIINNHLLAGMKTVGELFARGDMQLPFVLQSAEVMKMAVRHLEPHMEKQEGSTRGRVVLATVKGDVHDIGKNLVDIILSNNGWTVDNIGIKQSIENIAQAWRESGANAIGMSGLLVKSVVVMEENLHKLNEMKIDVPVLLGGAALSRHYCESHLREIYNGRVYYGKDAFEGLSLCEAIIQGQHGQLNAEIDRRLASREAINARIGDISSEESEGEAATAVLEGTVVRSEVATDIEIPTPPFWGNRVIRDIPLSEIFPYINTVALFRGQWGFRRGRRSKAEFEQSIEEEARPVFKDLQETLVRDEVLEPSLVYGWYPCGSEGNDLVVFDPEDHDRELERFEFPRQRNRRHLCISDYFRDVSSGVRDVLGLSCVTVGQGISELAQRLFADDQYTQYLYVHGMGVECAEALAELWHKRMRQELGIDGEDHPNIKYLFQQKYQGSRYSFGYPACPEMSDQQKLFRLLEPERIGCVLTENDQIEPEQSTSAIIVHHPEAKYFNV
ncbi:MAG: methionine synthase [Planctomycetota bacterium]|nr:methionine synthase [Planctomycetota bacterium]